MPIKKRISLIITTISSVQIVGIFSLPAIADVSQISHEKHDLHTVVTTAVMPSSPLTYELDPKKPRQPVPASDGADYLKTVAGFSAIRNGGSNSDPVLRGMFGSRINVLSNMGSMSGACPSRMDNTLSYISPETFDRLVIIKGPQTVLWGSGASAGTIRFERDKRQFETSDLDISGSLMAGSFGRNDQVVDVSAGNPNGYVRLNGNRSEAGDYRDGDGNKVPSSWKKWNSDVAIGLTPDKDTLIEFSVGFGDGEAKYAGRSMDGSQFKRETYGLKFEKEHLGPIIHGVSANVFYNSVDHVMDNYSFRKPNPMSSMAMPMASNVKRETVGGRVALDWKVEQWDGVFGIDTQHSEHQRRSATGENAYKDVAFSTDALFESNGLFTEVTFNSSEDTRLIMGARVDRANTEDKRESTGSGMMVMPNTTAGEVRKEILKSGFIRFEDNLSNSPVSWYSGIGYVERMPDYWELFSANRSAEGINAFESVDVERTAQIDIGLHYKTRQFDVWLSAYLNQISDYILFAYSSGGMMGMTSTVSNIDATTRGAEAGIEYRFDDNWKIESTLAYTWGRNKEVNTPLPQMPPLEARFSLGYDNQKWSSGLLVRAVTHQHRVAVNQGNVVGRDIEDSDGFVTVSINAGYKLSDTIQVTAGVDNLLDTTYAEHLNLAGNADFGFPADPTRFNEPGRNLWVKLNFKF